MQYLSYRRNDTPETLVKIEYQGDQDVKLVAALTYILNECSLNTSLSLILDSISWDLDKEYIFSVFNSNCTIVEWDIHQILNKDIVTMKDLFSI